MTHNDIDVVIPHAKNVQKSNAGSERIKSWPKKERPRERLLAEGPERLTDADLLTIILRVGLPMPKFIWICEISTPDLYNQGKVVGELIIDATANQFDRFAFLVIHYPDFLLLNDRNYLTDDPKRFNVHSVNTNDIISYHCYINNLHEA